MAHEALKFNVDIDKNKQWQPIVGDVYHGTFFMIYIKFKNVKENNGFYTYTVDLKLQNYNGSITMGLSLDEPQIRSRNHTTDITLIEEEIKKINKIRASKNEEPMSKEEESIFIEENRLDFDLEINVQPFNKKFEYVDELDPETKNKINNSIELGPIEKSLKGSVLNTVCVLQNPPIELYNANNVENSLYVNPHDYLRSGDEFLEIGLRDKGDTGDFKNLNQGGHKPLSKCNPSRSFLY